MPSQPLIQTERIDAVKGWIAAIAYLGWVITSAALIFQDQTFATTGSFLIGQILGLAILCRMGIFLNRWPGLMRGISVIVALYLVTQLLVLTYRIKTQAPLDLEFIYANRHDLWSTIQSLLSLSIILFGCTTILALCILLTRVLHNSQRVLRIGTRIPSLVTLLLILTSWGLLKPDSLTAAIFPLILHDDPLSTKSEASVLIPKFNTFHSATGESVFVLQLESGNALALNGLSAEGRDSTDYMPTIRAAAADGVLAQHMWGTSVQTHRGQGAILCSSVVDTSSGLTFRSPPTSCLPAVLKQDGYRTVFLSAHWESSFYNSDRFLKGIGFDDLQFATMMKSGDRRYDWGYDDCQFYGQAFNYLEERYGAAVNEKFLGYFEVSATHYPFEGHEEYRKHWPFPHPKDARENYLNSFAMQDRCVGVFLDRVKKFRKRAHVVIVADHSWPVGIQGSFTNGYGATSENFLVPFLYLPPTEGLHYQRGAVLDSPTPGQTDIFPTILELLGQRPFPNSFAHRLIKNPQVSPQYEDCQIVTQPYDGVKVSVIRGDQKLTYEASSRRILSSRLSPDFRESTPQVIAGGISYRAFKTRYFCDRYWRLLPSSHKGDCKIAESGFHCEQRQQESQ